MVFQQPDEGSRGRRCCRKHSLAENADLPVRAPDPHLSSPSARSGANGGARPGRVNIRFAVIAATMQHVIVPLRLCQIPGGRVERRNEAGAGLSRRPAWAAAK